MITREKKNIFFLSSEESKQIQERRNLKEKIWKVTCKKNMETFHLKNFMQRNFWKKWLKPLEGQTVNWKKQQKYQMKIDGKFPFNGGQVIA